jgi:release factor glutamine methyltransferase
MMADPGSTTSEQSSWTIGRLIDWTQGHFAARRLDAPRLAAELLLAHAMGCRKIDLYTRFQEIPPPDRLDIFRQAVRAAAGGVPVAYILGRKEFYGLDLEVTPDVLIPRPETETLVDQALAWSRRQPDLRLHILDLGTGSGCIGLALCVHLAAARVIGSDVSAAALEVARRNARRLELEDRFTCVQADALDLPEAAVPRGGFDLLVSNPPYIAENDPAVHPQVREHEPRGALFAGADGLAFFRLIADRAPEKLRPAARAFLEIGCGQHDQVVEIMTAPGHFSHVESHRDHIEGHWRVVVLQREPART